MSDIHDKPVILVVDDMPNNINVLKTILVPHYNVKAATNGKLAISIALKQKIDLILLDIMMPEIDGHEVCRILKSEPKTAKIPIIFVSALSEVTDEAKGIELGAIDYLTKPVVPAIVLARVKAHIELADQRRAVEIEVLERTKELKQAQVDSINMLGIAGHYNDTDTGVHIWRMAAYAALLAKAANWTVEATKMIELSAPMHDVGKIGIADEILKAPRRLTDEEMDIMKTHSAIGYKILSESNNPIFQMASDIALCHHEKWNGQGYPNGRSGTDIPQSARIVAIADVFDALTMKRPYKKPWSTDDAFAFIERERGLHFEPKLVDLFLGIKEEVLAIKDEWDKRELFEQDSK